MQKSVILSEPRMYALKIVLLHSPKKSHCSWAMTPNETCHEKPVRIKQYHISVFLPRSSFSAMEYVRSWHLHYLPLSLPPLPIPLAPGNYRWKERASEKDLRKERARAASHRRREGERMAKVEGGREDMARSPGIFPWSLPPSLPPTERGRGRPPPPPPPPLDGMGEGGGERDGKRERCSFHLRAPPSLVSFLPSFFPHRVLLSPRMGEGGGKEGRRKGSSPVSPLRHRRPGGRGEERSRGREVGVYKGGGGRTSPPHSRRRRPRWRGDQGRDLRRRRKKKTRGAGGTCWPGRYC